MSDTTMITVQRTVQLPIEYPGDEVWDELRAVACEAARYGNRVLASQYTQRSGLLADVLDDLGIEVEPRAIASATERVSYRYGNDKLSGWVRNAMKQHRARGYWRRSAKLVLRGSERLACYSADRALSIFADQRGNQGALYEWDDEDPVLVCRFRPARKFAPLRLTVALNSTRARKDPYIREAIERIWSGEWVPGVIHFRFDRRRRKLAALISYQCEVADADGDGPTAVLGPLTEDGQIWLRIGDRGPAVDWSDRLRLIREKKEHFAGLVDRYRRRAGRRGRSGRYHKYRRKLEELGSFAEWSHGVLHEWSAHVVEWCAEQGVGCLAIDGIDDGEWPAHQLRQMLEYKCEDHGIEYRESGDGAPAWIRAKQREARKEAQKLARAKDGLQAVESVVRAVG